MDSTKHYYIGEEKADMIHVRDDGMIVYDDTWTPIGKELTEAILNGTKVTEYKVWSEEDKKAAEQLDRLLLDPYRVIRDSCGGLHLYDSKGKGIDAMDDIFPGVRPGESFLLKEILEG